MGKATKLFLRYRLGQFPDNLDEVLDIADENDLKILVALQMAADADGAVEPMPDLRAMLGLEETEIEKSLKFWRVARVIGGKRSTPKAEPKAVTAEKQEEKKEMPPVSTVGTAHRNGAVAHRGVVAYDTAELANLLEHRGALADFVTEAQRVLGKTINYYDTSIVVGLVDQLGFEEEAVLAILAYAVRLKKATVRYAEKIALNLYDEGLTAADEVVSRIHAIEQAAETVSQIRVLFGMGSRALSSTEKKLFTKWTETYGFDMDVIRMAYDITIDAIHAPVPKYAGSILEKWYTEGLRTARDIEEFEREKKGTAGKVGLAKSYDVDDFFEASLKRSYESFDKDLNEPK